MKTLNIILALVLVFLFVGCVNPTPGPYPPPTSHPYPYPEPTYNPYPSAVGTIQENQIFKEINMTAEELAAIVGAVLSVLFAYVPGFANWFNPLGAEVKRIIMAALLIVTGGVVFGLACASLLNKVTCDFQGAWGLALAVLAAIVANQATFSILPKVGFNKTLK